MIESIPLLILWIVLGIVYGAGATLALYFMAVINRMAYEYATWSKIVVILNNIFLFSFIIASIINPGRESIHFAGALYIGILFFTVLPSTMSNRSQVTMSR